MQKETEGSVPAKTDLTKRIVKWMWISFAGFVLTIALLFVLIYIFLYRFLLHLILQYLV